VPSSPPFVKKAISMGAVEAALMRKAKIFRMFAELQKPIVMALALIAIINALDPLQETFKMNHKSKKLMWAITYSYAAIMIACTFAAMRGVEEGEDSRDIRLCFAIAKFNSGSLAIPKTKFAIPINKLKWAMVTICTVCAFLAINWAPVDFKLAIGYCYGNIILLLVATTMFFPTPANCDYKIYTDLRKKHGVPPIRDTQLFSVSVDLKNASINIGVPDRFKRLSSARVDAAWLGVVANIGGIDLGLEKDTPPALDKPTASV